LAQLVINARSIQVINCRAVAVKVFNDILSQTVRVKKIVGDLLEFARGPGLAIALSLFALGSGGAFLVIESKAHAQARGAKPFARLTNVVADMARRNRPGEITSTLEKLWSKLGKLEGKGAIITGATGAEPATSEERAFLDRHPDFAVRATGTMFGHTMETQFPLGLALAALSLSRGAMFPPNDPSGLEVEMSTPPSQIVVVGTGHWRGEGMALVEAIK